MNKINDPNPPLAAESPSPQTVSPMRKPLSFTSLLLPLLLAGVIAGGYFAWEHFRPLLSESMTTSELTAKVKPGQTLSEVQAIAGKEVRNEMAFSQKAGFNRYIPIERKMAMSTWL